ncbi:SOS response-associated peptidase [Novosphingobium sp. G106]|uniref:SOS response-associated peptidase family protein n=1 Tax=Novosphingobium sp. G106 TaxID=2849500 RepID=UPI001C2D5A59|nr:SOS response-associated peptidase family protein [Novosphingobium sp. G106]MBV1692556.1 SOS response-associated peptidase [Novosphingobium sp. G106]
MCNRKHQSHKAINAWFEAHGEQIDIDWTDRPGQLFPTGKKTPRHGIVGRRLPGGNRPLVAERMEWGFPHQVPAKRPGSMLDTFVTNARNLHLPLWRDAFASTLQRCLVPFTHFAEPHPAGGKGDDKLPRQAWFSLPDQPVGVFAGLWTETPRGRAYAFATCPPNEIVGAIHPKAMPAILRPEDWDAWLEGDAKTAKALIRPYDGPMVVQDATPVLEKTGG